MFYVVTRGYMVTPFENDELQKLLDSGVELVGLPVEENSAGRTFYASNASYSGQIENDRTFPLRNMVVYGTLRFGFGNHPRMGKSEYRDATAPGMLLVGQGIPFAFVSDEDDAGINVEVYNYDELTHEEFVPVLRRVDSLEGFGDVSLHNDNPKAYMRGSTYFRAITKVVYEDGTEGLGFIYQCSRGFCVPSGKTGRASAFEQTYNDYSELHQPMSSSY